MGIMGLSEKISEFAYHMIPATMFGALANLTPIVDDPKYIATYIAGFTLAAIIVETSNDRHRSHDDPLMHDIWQNLKKMGPPVVTGTTLGLYGMQKAITYIPDPLF